MFSFPIELINSYMPESEINFVCTAKKGDKRTTMWDKRKKNYVLIPHIVAG